MGDVNPAAASRAEYAARMHRVFEYIDRRLDQPLDLKTLAGVAHFSPFHFHRLFAAWSGETLGDYLRRRRLEIAAARLLSQPRTAVLEIALGVGFGSGEAFARAFSARFGAPPSRWRRQVARQRAEDSNPGQVLRKADQASAPGLPEHGGSTTPVKELPMNVSLVQFKPQTVAYLRHLGPYGEVVGRFWQETVYPWLATNGLLAETRYGVSQDDPGITVPERCRYDACVAVPEDFVPNGGALKTTLPGGRYAVLHFDGTLAEIGPAWDALLRDWLPQSGLQLDARPCFEHYPIGSRWDAASGRFECGICVPVAPL